MNNQTIEFESIPQLVDLYNKMSEQNRIIKSINLQLTDSLKYAGKLQKALIPPKEYINKVFPNNFIFYKPKNFVSGDFYWVLEKGNKAILVVADSTGHGVPGALMSILGITCLNEIGNLFSQTHELSASDMLNLLRSQVISSLHQTGDTNEMKDGIDIALCVIDKESLQVQYAGAFIPLYIIRQKELIEYHGDKMPIGIYELCADFTEQTIQLEAGDMLYLFTDGYADQFGGVDNRKFKLRKLKELLIEISDKALVTQKQILKDVLADWQNDHEQIDDITGFGIRIGPAPSGLYSI